LKAVGSHRTAEVCRTSADSPAELLPQGGVTSSRLARTMSAQALSIFRDTLWATYSSV